jgi:hypothetical protein
MGHRDVLKIARLCSLAAVIGCLGAGTASAAPVSCGETVTTDVVLDRDLVGCQRDGLVVATSDVVVDLNGHSVRGAVTGAGILIDSPDDTPIRNISVTNGVVQGFRTGVSVEGDRRAAIRHVTADQLTIAENQTGVTISWYVNDLVLSDNSIIRNLGDGVITASDSWPVDIVANRVVHNGGRGVRIYEDSARFIRRNFVAHNAGTGLEVVDSVSTIADNVLLHNGGLGLSVYERIPSYLPYYVVAHNVAEGNATGGMSAVTESAPPGGPAGEGNSAKHNGIFDCSMLIICTFNRGGLTAPRGLEMPMHLDTGE